MVILKAFIESDVCAKWLNVWQGDTLRQLDIKTFTYFKKFYGVENMSLASSFESCDDYFDYYNDSYSDEFFDDDFKW